MMVKFLIKGILRDKLRSRFPILIVSAGVMLTVLLHCWISGVLGEIIDTSAAFATGHVKIMSRAYAENEEQIPNDLALGSVETLIKELKQDYPDMIWVKRIRFGGLLDVPDDEGETRSQGPVMGLAVQLFSDNSGEVKRLNIEKALVKGKMPEKATEVLISDVFASKLKVQPGDKATLISSTMYGSMAMQNFTVTGTVSFGVMAMDRAAMIMDISDAQTVLDMYDSAGEILGYFDNNVYFDEKAKNLVAAFNSKYKQNDDEFAPAMLRLAEQNGLDSMLEYVSNLIGVFIIIFIFAMSIVLWNAALVGGLRRYGEVGLRLAIGENKGHVYSSMLLESVFIGFMGSVVGTFIGLGISYYLQTVGFDISDQLQNVTMMVPSVFRAHITPRAYYIGFVPGLFSTVLGTALAGIGIYRRNTARLFKELEV
jgi:putative ABC transport system permease protein